jgi:hypothetical protein
MLVIHRTLGLIGMLVWATTASATTVTFDVVTSLTNPQSQVTVAPGGTVDYVITVLVMPDDASDNSGFAAGGVDLVTNLGVAQPPATELASTVNLFSDLGTPEGDDLTGIFGSQQFPNPGVIGYARGQAAEFARGALQSPQTLGSYTVGTQNGVANILRPGMSGSAAADEVLQGSGFTIVVAVPPPAVQAPLTEGDTVVTVGGLVADATQVRVFVNGVQSETANPGGASSVQVTTAAALAAGDSVTATQATAAGESQASAAVIVEAAPSEPTPSGGICGAGTGGFLGFSLLGLVGLHSGRRHLFSN